MDYFFGSLLNSIYSRKVFASILAVCAAICTGLTIWEPAVNAFALMLLVIPTFGLLFSAIKEFVYNNNNNQMKSLFLLEFISKFPFFLQRAIDAYLSTWFAYGTGYGIGYCLLVT